MRKILTKDIFSLARIIKKAKVKENLKNLDFKKETDDNTEVEKTIDTIGMEVLMIIVEAGADTEKEIYTLIESIAETTNLAERPFEDFIDIIKNIAKENNLINFFKQASQLNL